jgi:hypothetical protein
VQVDPMKPTLKPPGTKRLKLKCDILLLASGFKLNLRRYSEADGIAAARRLCPALDAVLPPPVVLPDFTAAEAGAYTRPLFSST